MADRVLTVSPSYALEIQLPESGEGLHELLEAKGAHLRLAGILNGISDEWNPKTDPHIAVNYGIMNFEENKALCKAGLQKKLGLDVAPDVALIGFCARLCSQKGVHLITAIIPWLMQDQGNDVNGRVQIILMGQGEVRFAEELRQAEQKYAGRICGYVGFDPRVEHQMMAACDFYLMPSQYEPCGLPQMYAQQYGTLPIVHATGGLKDSVQALSTAAVQSEERTLKDTEDSTAAVQSEERCTGFAFTTYTEDSLKERIYHALEVYHKRKHLFRQMQLNALRCNHYWPKAIDEYEEHIDWTLESQPSRQYLDHPLP